MLNKLDKNYLLCQFDGGLTAFIFLIIKVLLKLWFTFNSSRLEKLKFQ